MKKKFEKVEIEIIEINNDDVLTAVSGNADEEINGQNDLFSF